MSVGEQVDQRSQARLPIALFAAVILIPTALALGFSEAATVCLAISAVLMTLAWTRMRPALICGYFVFGLFLTVTAIGGFLLSDTISQNSGTAIAQLQLSSSEKQATVVLLAMASSAVLAGGLFASAVLKSRGLKAYGIRENASNLFSKLSATVLLVAGGNLLFAAGLNGLEPYIDRDDYHLAASGGLEGLPDLIAIASVVILGALLVATKSTGQRLLAVVLIFASWTYFFSLATRAFALTPLLVALGMACVARSKWIPWFTAAMAILSISLLELPLYLRGLARHGIVPYAQALTDFPNAQWNPITTAGNVLGGFHIVGATAFSSPPIPMEVFWISVAPQTGTSAGWYDVSDTLRLGPALPYGSVGEIGNHGFVFTVFFYFIIGCMLGVLHWLTSIILERYKYPLAAVVIVGLQFNMVILATQYNLRSEMRTLYYAIALAIFTTIVGMIAANRRQKREVGPISAARHG